VKANDVVLRNMQNQGQNLQIQMANLTDMLSKFVSSNTASSSGSATLPSNTITNLKKDLKGITTRSGVAYQGPTIPTLSKVMKQGTEPVVAPVSAPMPNLKPSIPYHSRRDNERRRDQANEQIEKFYKIFKDMSFDISFTDALILMPKFASTLKALIRNKEKFSEMARTPMNEHCSTVILNKLPRKLGEPDKFLIPCKFPRMDKCLSLADLGASINLMPLSVWEGLSLPELTPTCMTLELADCSVSKPIGSAEDVSVKVGVFKAKTVKSSVDEPPEVELKDLPPHLEYAFLECDNKFPVIIAKELGDEEKSALIKVLKSHKRAIAWKLSDIQGINLEFCTHKILMEEDTNQCPWVSPVHCEPKKGGFTVVENEENKLIPTRLVTGWQVCIDYRKLNEATRKDHFPLPFMDQMLERLARNEYYCFLDGFSGYFQIPIEPRDQEKTTFTCPYGTFAYQMKVFMDDFSVFGNSFENCLSRLDKMLQRCEDTNLCLNWEKSHFMVKEGIVLGHKISKNEIKVDKSKVDVIAKLPHPTTVKGAENLVADHLSRLENLYENVLDPKEINETFPLETLSMVTFRGDSSAPWFADFANYHAGNFIIKDTNLCLNWEKSHFMVKEGIALSHKISKNRTEVDKAKVDVIAKLPHLTTVEAFQMLKKKLTEAPILIAPNWDLLFELMYDASDFTIGNVSHGVCIRKILVLSHHEQDHSAYGSFRPQVSPCQKGCQGETVPVGSTPPRI
nr:reverse transcriptase domain-containing protein [Tanacetum cinerariifolium]